MRLASGLALLAMTATVGTSSADAATTAPCTRGRISGTTLRTENAVSDAARARFLKTLHGVSAADRAHAGAAFETALAAYLYGYPIIQVRQTIADLPVNQMISVATLATPAVKTVVAPNDDTLYSVGQLSLAAGPIVITSPPSGQRYSVLQLMDGFTDVDAYIGEGASARTGETALVVAPGWHGTVPAGMRLIRAQTNALWLLGRTLVQGPSDTGAAVALLKRYAVTTLNAYEAGQRSGPTLLPTFPIRKAVQPQSGIAFFDALGGYLASDPPPAADACALRAFAAQGIGADKTPSTALNGLRRTAVAAAAHTGPAALNAIVARLRHERGLTLGGWGTSPADTGRFGTDYVARAVVARIGLGANTRSSALYLTMNEDATGKPLNGRRVYTVTFTNGQIPPANAFWSMTLYNADDLLYANPLQRYSIGNRTRGLRYDRDGGLTITVSHIRPRSAPSSNWLPAPTGSFSLYLRLYEPKPGALNGRWLPPQIVRTDG